MALKIPPPPPFAGPQWQQFNRWLLEMTSILSNQGGIDPSEVTGLSTVITQVGTNTTDITELESTQGGQGADITALQADITAINGEISTINGQITSLSARAQVLNGVGVPNAGLGNNGDLFLNNTGGSGTRLYGKIAGAWVSIA